MTAAMALWASLASAASEAPRTSPQTVASARVECTCPLSVPEVVAKCEVLGFARLGVVAGREIYARTRRCSGLDRVLNTHVTIFDRVPSSDRVRQLWEGTESPNETYLERPEILQTRFGPLIHVGRGSGQAVREDACIAWCSGDFGLVDWTTFTSKLGLPPGHVPARVFPDWNAGRYDSSVRVLSDCRACATGGEVNVSLELRGCALVPTSVKYVPPPPASARSR